MLCWTKTKRACWIEVLVKGIVWIAEMFEVHVEPAWPWPISPPKEWWEVEAELGMGMEVEAPGKVVEEKDEDGAEVAPTLPEAAVFCEDEITKDWFL